MLTETQLRAVKPRRLYQDVARQIQDLIHDGSLKPGDRLPPERDLAERLEVSRSSLREAMRTLELQNLIISRPGAGTFVIEEASDLVTNVLADYLTSGRDALRDVFEVRHILEPKIAALASDRATHVDILRLEDGLSQQSAQISMGETGAEGDAAFHFAIAEAAHNSALLKLVTTVADILSQSREQPFQAPGRPQRSLASHRYILDMIKQGDSEGAREAMEHHISVVEPFYAPDDVSPSGKKKGDKMEPREHRSVVDL